MSELAAERLLRDIFEDPAQREYRCPHVGREDEHCPCVDPGNENGPAADGRVSA